MSNEPVNPNPAVNSDATRSNISENDKSTWASPKSSDGYLRMDQDDLYPERKERLVDYLSNSSLGANETDVTNNTPSQIPISNATQEEFRHFGTPEDQEQFIDLLDEAADMFENHTSGGWSFTPTVGIGGARNSKSGREQDGNQILNNARGLVQTQIDNAASDSRWRNLQTADRFPDARYYGGGGEELNVQNAEDNQFYNYEHPTGQLNQESYGPDFWEEYYKRMGYVGASITLGAQGYDDPAGANKIGEIGSAIDKSASGNVPDVASLDGIDKFQKISLDSFEPGQVFEDGVPEWTEDEKYINAAFSHAKNNKSWGQHYSWADPFEQPEFLGEKSLPLAQQLLDIGLSLQLRALAVASLFQAGQWFLSELDAIARGGVEPYWNKNYYSPNVQEQSGLEFRKGQSGFNHSGIGIIEELLDLLNETVGSEIGEGVDAMAVSWIAMLAGGAVNNAGIVAEDYLNTLRNVLREVNIYIPRHTLSVAANVSGYNSPDKGGTLAALGYNLLQALDVATAYSRASLAGLAQLFVHISIGDMGSSVGFWKNLLREITRSNAALQENIDELTNYESMLRWTGKDDKMMRFVNYLAMIGDMSVGRGFAGKLAFPENKVPLDAMTFHPALRTATYRKSRKSSQSTFSLTDTPSLMLLPASFDPKNKDQSPDSADVRLYLYGVEAGTQQTVARFSGENALYNGITGKGDETVIDKIKDRYQVPENKKRFSPAQVRAIENQLEAEQMPFYIQDLRTNEIISFHAFLTSLSDSYTGEWSAQKGFGRMEAAQIYGGGSRAIGVSFSMVAMNEDDFEEMWIKINKLTTLVYPQWSEGTLMQSGEDVFIQPFSQVPTASPLCRIRVGDLFTSNFSKKNMARMMGIANPQFKYGEPPEFQKAEIKETNIPDRAFMRRFKRKNKQKGQAYFDLWKDDREQFDLQIQETENGAHQIILVKLGDFGLDEENVVPDALFEDRDKAERYLKRNSKQTPIIRDEAVSNSGISPLFSNENPIMKAFESTMGRGIAVAVTGITFDWKLGSSTWNLEAGSKAPRMCDVQLSITPIHDITPGLDHEGFNRAPIYKVGQAMRDVGGDPWYNNEQFSDLQEKVDSSTAAALNGKKWDKDEE